MDKVKPILLTAAVTLITLIVYRKFLSGKFGLPEV